MPNYVQNILNIEGDKKEVDKVLKAVSNAYRTFDFERLIPMPRELEIEAGTRTQKGFQHYQKFVGEYFLKIRDSEKVEDIPENAEKEYLANHPELDIQTWELGKKAFENYTKYGAISWYEWSVQNWNCKWNAMNTESERLSEENASISFQTAWSAPHPVIEKMAEMFPDVKIMHRWADEDIGRNVGEREYRNGETEFENILCCGKESFELAFDIWETTPYDMGLLLNKSQTEYINIQKCEFETVDICGKKGLFTEERFSDSQTPDGFYRYELRSSDNGSDLFVTLENRVGVNFSGTVLTAEEIELGKDGYLTINSDNPLGFTGETDISIKEFMEMNLDEDFENDFSNSDGMKM